MKYRVVCKINGCFDVEEYPNYKSLMSGMEIRGNECVGAHMSTRTRAELNGAPKFKGLLGPMWDGDAIRYEDQATYDIMST